MIDTPYEKASSTNNNVDITFKHEMLCSDQRSMMRQVKLHLLHPAANSEHTAFFFWAPHSESKIFCLLRIMPSTYVFLALKSRCWIKKKTGRIANREEAVSIVQRRLPRYCCHRDKMHLQGFFFLSLSAQALQLSDLERTAGTSLPEKKNWATLARTLIPPWHLLSMQVTEDFCLFWVSLFIKVIFCL